MGHEEDTQHVELNRDLWDSWADEWLERGRRAWEAHEPAWGIYQIPESKVGLLKSFGGGAAIELGCGTAYVSEWIRKLGGCPTALDNSRAQLQNANKLQNLFDVSFPLIHADAENLPFDDGSFDFAISEYGAAIWCDPYRWIPEAARVLRSGGRLVFLGSSTQLMLSVSEDGAATNSLNRPLRGMHRMEWDDDPGVEFHISHGERIRVLRENSFEVEELIELYPDDVQEESPFTYATLDWAKRWPVEEAWVARKL